jgi:2-octaprenyl-6-methoxyphenol hydroxylase
MAKRNGLIEACDVIIAGGGLSGMVAATRLGHAGMRVAVVESLPREALASPKRDGRTTALAYGSTLILEECGIWQKLAGMACPIDDIRVADQHSPLILDFASAAVESHPFGYIVENSLLRETLFKQASAMETVQLFCPASITKSETSEETIRVELADGRQLEARLLLAADGRKSFCRTQAGIPVREWSYNETALVTTISHSLPHDNQALEHFYPGGPFAMLPMTENRCSIVWTEKPDTAASLAAMPEAEFVSLLMERGGDYLGKIALAAPRQLYPLHFMLAEQLHAPRIALAGEAAHAMHPIAGQGFNLSVRDIDTLAQQVIAAWQAGEDWGSDAVLAAYDEARHMDHFTFMAATDLLSKLFAIRFPPVKWARQLGMGLVGKLPPAKKFFSRMAMGLLGE